MSTMTPSPQFRNLVKLLFERRRPPGAIGIDELRAGFESTALPLADDVERIVLTLGGMAIEELTTAGADPTRLVLYLHGGGYVMGSPNTHRKLAGDLARASGARVLLPDYPLAPEHPFPAAIHAIGALYETLLATGVSPDRVALAGDSAGGGLVAAVLTMLRDRAVPLPAAAVLISPWLDLVGDAAVDERDPVVAFDDLALFRNWYLNGSDPRQPLASPVSADLRGLPPMLVHIGGAEILVDDARRFADACRRDDVRVELDIWPDMIHVWHIFAGRVPESTAAVERVGDFLRAHLGGGRSQS